MKTCVLFLLVVGSVYGAPVEQGGIQPGSCEDASAVSAAHLALSKINLDRSEGYIFSLHRLSNVHLDRHGETGVVYYLNLDVVETECSVLSRKNWKQCEARSDAEIPVYGQCKAVIYINKPHRVVRLYKYDCVLRPVPAARVIAICPDCPTFISADNEQIQKLVSRSLEKFNNESGLNNHFALLEILHSSAGMVMTMHYSVDYTIQETICGKYKQAPAGEKCPLMTCEFSHKGFCKASFFETRTSDPEVSVNCEIYEQEAAEREKVQHLLGDTTDHPHNDTHSHEHGKGHDHDKEHGKGHSHGRGHGQGRGQGQGHEHGQGRGRGQGQGHEHGQGQGQGRGQGQGQGQGRGHGQGPGRGKGHSHLSEHDHTTDHSHHDAPHPDGSKHHHTHDHKPGSAYRQGHAHSHDHGIDSDHDHHTGGFPNHHHNYTHPKGTHTHDHDHELALDHEHKHAHLHEHEHHHHHHTHQHETEQHDEPEGLIRILPAIDQPMTLPSFPDVPAGGPGVGVTLPLKPDPSIPGVTEPIILAFPTSLSAECAIPAAGSSLVSKLFMEDPLFKPAA
ncbi:fetuin B [Anableps anableps]